MGTNLHIRIAMKAYMIYYHNKPFDCWLWCHSEMTLWEARAYICRQRAAGEMKDELYITDGTKIFKRYGSI